MARVLIVLCNGLLLTSFLVKMWVSSASEPNEQFPTNRWVCCKSVQHYKSIFVCMLSIYSVSSYNMIEYQVLNFFRVLHLEIKSVLCTIMLTSCLKWRTTFDIVCQNQNHRTWKISSTELYTTLFHKVYIYAFTSKMNALNYHVLMKSPNLSLICKKMYLKFCNQVTGFQEEKRWERERLQAYSSSLMDKKCDNWPLICTYMIFPLVWGNNRCDYNQKIPARDSLTVKL